MFKTPEPPKNDDFEDDAESAAWFLSLTTAEMMAVRFYVKTGDPTLVDALKFTSPNLRDMDFPPFNPADLVEVSAEMCIREIDSDKPGYVSPDYRDALPIHLHPLFQALSWRVQTLVRVHLWLIPAGDVAQVVGRWIVDTLDANPDIDYETLSAYERRWTVPRLLHAPRPFHGLAHGDAGRAFWYATGDFKLPPQFVRRRKPLSPAESALCEEAISATLAMLAEPDDTLAAWQLDAVEVVRAAWNS